MTFDIDHVLASMTDAEKIAIVSGTDFWHTAAFDHHNVPAIRVSDGPNGIRGTKFFAGVPAACLPCGTGLGATWDKDLLKAAGVLLGKECLAKGASCWLGPTINIQRSPLGGRGFESFAEDPHLSGVLAANIIQGCESTGVLATPKHYVCNDQEHKRSSVDTLVTPRALREIYLRPFQIAARDANPGAVMSGYNKVNGSHVSQDPILLGLIRQEWKWNPLIMSDWYGCYSCVKAMEAGLDLEMPGPAMWRGKQLQNSLMSGEIRRSVIEDRARKVLEFVQKASKAPASKTEGGRNFPEDQELNRRLSANSLVLLKNDDHVLPLPKKMKKLALIGSHMKTPAFTGGGSASLEPYYLVSLYDAIKKRVGAEVDVQFETGMSSHKLLPVLERDLRDSNGDSTAVLKFYNEHPSVPNRECVGQEALRDAHFQLMDYNKSPKLNFELFYANFEADFTPEVSATWEFGVTTCGTANLYLDDELVVDNTSNQKPGDSFFGMGTIEECGTKKLEAGKTYKLRLEFGSSDTTTLKTTGTVTFHGGGARVGGNPRITPEESIKAAVKLASESDYAVICTGVNSDWGSEGFDRRTMDMPPHVDDMIQQVVEANPKTVVVNESGTPVTMPWIHSAKAVIQAWYGGNESGNGIADVLFGDVNPSGKLPLSWPIQLKHNPSYLNFGSVQGRVLYGEDIYVGYRYFEKMEMEPLFSFGHGLSYTTFELSNLSVSQDHVAVSVTNTGSREGAEVVQVYIAAPDSEVQRPVKELHGFQKVVVAAGQTEHVKIAIDKYAGSFWDESEGRWLLEAGKYEVLVGTSSSQIHAKGEFSVPAARHWLGL